MKISVGEDFFSVNRPVYIACMIYGGCFYHIVSGFFFFFIFKSAGWSGDDFYYDDDIYSGDQHHRYDRNQIGVNHCHAAHKYYNVYIIICIIYTQIYLCAYLYCNMCAMREYRRGGRENQQSNFIRPLSEHGNINNIIVRPFYYKRVFYCQKMMTIAY